MEKLPNQIIHSELVRDIHIGYHRTNSLINNPKKQKLMKKVPINNQTHFEIYYGRGRKDDFCVPIYQVNNYNHQVINTLNLSDNEVFQETYELAHTEQPGINARKVVTDILIVYQHIHENYIDTEFLIHGIDKIADTYPTAHLKSWVNILLSYYLLVMTTEYFFVKSEDGRKSIMGPKIKILGLSKMFNDGMSSLDAANYCHNRDAFMMDMEVDEIIENLHNHNYPI